MRRFPEVFLFLAAGVSGCTPASSAAPGRVLPGPVLSRPSLSRAAPSPEDPMARVLAVDFRGMELAEALRVLSRSGAARFSVETSGDLTGREPVSLCASAMPVGGILDWIARQADTWWMREGETVWIARGLPRAALAGRRTVAHDLRAVTAPAGGARVDAGDLSVRTVYDPGRREAGEEEAGTGGPDRAPGPEGETETGPAAAFLAIAREALEPLGPEPRLTPTREGFLADLPERGHERLAAILDAFERIRSVEPRAFDAGGEAALSLAAARSTPDLSVLLPVDLSAGDAESVFRALARTTGVPIGWDARSALLRRPEPVSLDCAGKSLAWALDRLAGTTPWTHRRVEPGRGVWLSPSPADPAEGDRMHPWDRCVVGAWRLPEEWLSRRGADGIVAAVRAELSPAPTRGMGRVLAVHTPGGILLAVQEPETAARIEGILDRFRKGFWPGWKSDEK